VYQISILVTGGSGFIGSHVVDKLIENDFDVKVFDVKTPHHKDVEFIKGNITSLKRLNTAMNDVEYVYHIAALSNINKVVENPLKAVDLNIVSTAKILEAARNSKVRRVIFASSYFVDSGKGHLYTTTKAASEMLCKDYYKLYGLPFTILRYGTAYGPRSRGEDVISIAVRMALSRQTFVIHGDGNQSRNFIYVEDLAEGSVAALSNNAENKTYYLEGLQQITVKEVAEIVKKLVGNIKVEYKEARPEDYTGKTEFNDESKKDLDWWPKIDFEEGVRRYIEWYKTTYKI
jgi:UDP-glucose 4-epimerase